MKPNTEYLVDRYDTYKGTISSSEILKSDTLGDLTIQIQNLDSDIAIKISMH